MHVRRGARAAALREGSHSTPLASLGHIQQEQVIHFSVYPPGAACCAVLIDSSAGRSSQGTVIDNWRSPRYTVDAFCFSCRRSHERIAILSRQFGCLRLHTLPRARPFAFYHGSRPEYRLRLESTQGRLGCHPYRRVALTPTILKASKDPSHLWHL